MEDRIFVVDVTDDRGFYLIKALKDEGYRAYMMQGDIIGDGQKVYVYALGKILNSLEIEDLENNSILFSRIDNKAKEGLDKKNIKHFNLLYDNKFLIKNAYITAEGALAEIIKRTDSTLMNMPVLVMGYGRIGKYLVKMLKALNAKVSVASKSQELKEAKQLVEKTIELERLEMDISSFKVIVNTIPLKIIKGELIRLVACDTYIMDLASSPGGIDFEQAEKRGIMTHHFLGVPGKISPKTAAEYVKESIFRSLKEI